MHGCVRATFEVHDNIEPSLRHGLFATAGTYDAYVRFSSAQPTIGPDSRPDVRGMAIKIMGVDGAKLLEGDETCSTQDFITISHNAFVVRNVAEFDELMSSFTCGPLRMAWYLARHPRVAARVLAAFGRHASLTDITYHSVTPYLLGQSAVKYAVAPSVAKAKTPMPKAPSYNFLREDLKRTLASGTFSFDFMVQRQSDPRRMPVEDATKVWPVSESPFRKVATLTLQVDDFDTPDRQEFGDNLSFNPWRCLPEHRPLGGLNRARRIAYRALSGFRHERNAGAQNEPSS